MARPRPRPREFRDGVVTGERRSSDPRRGFALVAIDRTATAFARHVDATRPDVVVVDGYAFGEAEQEAARAAGAVLVVVDDNREVPVDRADVLVNQNAPAATIDYGSARGELLLRPKYPSAIFAATYASG